jgi:hypothetical protein
MKRFIRAGPTLFALNWTPVADGGNALSVTNRSPPMIMFKVL